MENVGVLLRLLGRREEAIDVLLEAHEMDRSRFNICDALAHSLGSAGRTEEMERYGRLSLELKDARAAEKKALATVPDGPPPPFGERKGRKQVISFSLWGRKARYLRGAVRNVQAAFDVYPGWVCRFYCDESVPKHIRDLLVRHGAEVVMRPSPVSFFDGLLWRFEVFEDEGVDRFLIRDCDSVVGVQERVAVDAWIQSDRWFHTMRDFPSHTEVLLAGMWGGVQGVLPPVGELRRNFRPDTAPTRTFDQVFLRDCVWPIVRQSVLIHDSVYTGCLGSEPFPELGRLPFPFHVGQNEAAVRRDVVVDLPDPKPGQVRPLLILSGADPAAVEAVAKSMIEGGEVERLGKGPLSAWIEGLAEVNRNFTGTGMASQDAELEDLAVAGTALSALCLREMKERDAAFLLVDDSGDLARVDLLARAIGARVICVVRDPRATARARGIESPEEADAWAQRWRGSIEQIARISRERPGEAELVRCEDLVPERAASTWKRLAGFLGFPSASFPPVPDFEEGSTGSLPAEIEGRLEESAGPMMKRLQYLSEPSRA